MHAFVQRLPCGVHVFFRAGPLAKKYGDDWTHGCLGEVEGFTWFERLLVSALQWLLTRSRGRSVTLMGYDDKAMPPLMPGVLKAMTRAAIKDGFDALTLDRLGENPRKLVLTSTEEGKITMTAITKHVDHSKKPDGTHDQAKVIEATEEALAHMKSGKLIVEPVAQFKHGGKTFKVFATNE